MKLTMFPNWPIGPSQVPNGPITSLDSATVAKVTITFVDQSEDRSRFALLGRWKPHPVWINWLVFMTKMKRLIFFLVVSGPGETLEKECRLLDEISSTHGADSHVNSFQNDVIIHIIHEDFF